MTWRPAARTAFACGRWRSLGEVTWTRRRSGRRAARRATRYARGTPSAVGPCRATLRGAAEDATHLDPDPAQRLDMDGADEARADDGGADVGDRSRHALPTTLRAVLPGATNLSRHLPKCSSGMGPCGPQIRQVASRPPLTPDDHTLSCQVQKSTDQRTKNGVSSVATWSCRSHAPLAGRGARRAGHGPRRDPARSLAIAVRTRRPDRASVARSSPSVSASCSIAAWSPKARSDPAPAAARRGS